MMSNVLNRTKIDKPEASFKKTKTDHYFTNTAQNGWIGIILVNI